MNRHSRSLQLTTVVMVVVVVLAHPAIVGSVSAAGNGELTINVKHENGDQADEVNALLIYQDGSYYDKIENYDGVELKHTFSNLPTGHEYKVDAYIQDQFAGSTGDVTISANNPIPFVDPSSKSKTITAENPIELSPTVYYSDGSTPIEGASVQVKSHEDITWRSATTESDGETDPSPLYLYPTDGDDAGSYTVEVFRDGEKISSGDYDDLSSDSDLKINTDASVPEYDLSASAAPSSGGDIDGEPFGSVERGTEEQLTADPDSGYEFDHWSGDYPSGSREDADISVTVDEDKSLTAHFEKETHELQVSTQGEGSVRIIPPSTRSEEYSREYTDGTSVTLRADPESGSQFTGWEGDTEGADLDSRRLEVTMSDSRDITATFEKRIRICQLLVSSYVHKTRVPVRRQISS